MFAAAFCAAGSNLFSAGMRYIIEAITCTPLNFQLPGCLVSNRSLLSKTTGRIKKFKIILTVKKANLPADPRKRIFKMSERSQYSTLPKDPLSDDLGAL